MTPMPTSTQAQPAPGAPAARRRWRVRWSVRTRVLTALVALSALALLVAGATAFILERGRVDAQIEDSLRRSEDEFRTFANEGRDPETGEAFTSAGGLLRTAMGRIVPSDNEGMLGFVGGEVTLQAAAEYELQLQEDPELVAALGPLTESGGSALTSIETSTTSYRVLVVPVSAPDGSTGGLVLAFDRSAEQAELATTYQRYALVALGAILLIGAFGFTIVSDLLKPIALLRSAAAQVSSTDLSRRIRVVGNDDLAVLTTTVNTMLDRLEQSFASQRELLDDVGHELRTPLTVVRGHLELMDPADPEDAAAARAVALDELDRMNALVEELMTLARARRPDFITPRPTDLAELTDEVLTKARPLGERRWTLDHLAETTVDLDPHRITQAWLQLVSNAVRYSEPGSVLALGSRFDGEHVRLWVRDEGVGIAPEDHERVFARFARVAPASTEGSGLGLTIVRSIVDAHGGHVELESALGRGSVFTMVLPHHPDLPDHDATTTTQESS